MYKKTTLLAAIVVILVMLLAACGRSGNNDAADTVSGGLTFTGYPMYAPGTTVTIYVANTMGMHHTLSNAEESPFFIGLNEALGVDIQWIHPVAGAGDELTEMNLMIASGDLPDVIINHQIMPDAERLIDEGVFRDLTPFIQQHAPYYHAVLLADPVRHNAMRTDTGRYFGFGFFREDGGWNDTFQGPLVRQDWLEELGLPVPTTISDWDTTLRAFNEAFGATLVLPWGRFNTTGFIAGAFGAHGSTQYRLFIDPATDTIQLAQTQPEWRDFIAHMHMWWSEGLINQDLLTLDDSMVRSMMLNDESGLSFSAMSQITLWTHDAEETNSGARWVGAPYPTSDDGSISMVFGGPGITGFVAGITTNVDDDRLPIIMRILDYAYTPEGHLHWNFGVEGVSWNMVDGRPEFSDYLRNAPEGLHEAMQMHSGTVWGGPAIQATEIIVQRNHPIAVEANNTWFWTHTGLPPYFAMPRGMALNAEEANRAGELEGALRTYVSEMAVRFLTGAEPIENFDAFVATVESMGLEEILSLHQSAFDRFNAR